MGISIFPPLSKTRYALTLTSGTSWTVPAGVNYVNVTLQGGGGGGNLLNAPQQFSAGQPGQRVSSTLTTTPGASITYAIGAGGAAFSSNTGATGSGGTGGTTTFTGATSATGGLGANGSQYTGSAGTSVAGFFNGGLGAISASPIISTSGAGGAGMIELEYWV